MPEQTKEFKVSQKTIGYDRIRDLLIGAFEGGSNYWLYQINNYQYAPGTTVEDYKKGGKFNNNPNDTIDYGVLYNLPFVDGAAVELITDDASVKDEWSDPDSKEKNVSRVLLNKSKIEKGLAIFAEDHPRHFADFLSENDDATTADVFIQCVLFGKEIFG